MFAELRTDIKSALSIARPGALMYRDAQYLAATLTVDTQRLRRWLPPGVSLTKEARADLFCAYFPDNTIGAVYHEAGLFVHINVWGKTGIFCPWMIVDNDAALILGRELLGYPKKMGDFTWLRNGDELRASGARHGQKLVQMTARVGDVIIDPPPFLGRPHRNLIGTLGLSMPRLLAFTPMEINVETRKVDMSVQFDGNAQDPLHEMGLGEVVAARLHRVNLGSSWRPPFPVRPVSLLFLLRHMRLRMF